MKFIHYWYRYESGDFHIQGRALSLVFNMKGYLLSWMFVFYPKLSHMYGILQLAI